MAESEMVERVARALDPDAFAERLPGHEKGKCPSCDYRTELAMSQARKAIEAMREPTEAMVDAVGSDYGAALEHQWQAMIDAALKP